MKDDIFSRARMEIDRKEKFLKWKSEHVNDNKIKRKINGISLNDPEIIHDMILMNKAVYKKQNESMFYLDNKKSSIENLKQISESLFHLMNIEKDCNERKTGVYEITRTDKKSKTTIQEFNKDKITLINAKNSDNNYSRRNKRYNTIATQPCTNI